MTTGASALPFFYFPELLSLTPNLHICQQNKTLVNIDNKTYHLKWHVVFICGKFEFVV